MSLSSTGLNRQDKRCEIREWGEFFRETGHLLRQRPAQLFQEAANQPEASAPSKAANRRFAAGLEKRPWLRLAKKPKELSPCLVTMVGHKGIVTCCAFSLDGSRVVSGSQDGTLRMWECSTGEQLSVMNGHGYGGIVRCAYSPDGSVILSSAAEIQDNVDRFVNRAGDISLWDAKSGAHLRAFDHDKSSRGRIVNSCFSPDGSRVLAGGGEFAPGWLKVWDVASGHMVLSVFGKHRLITCAWLPDSQRILAAWDGEQSLHVLDASSGRILMKLSGSHWDPTACACSSDGQWILYADFYHLWLWDAKSGEQIRDYEPRTFSLQGCSFSPDSQRFISRSIEPTDAAFTLWDTETGDQVAWLGSASDSSEGVSFSRDGAKLATATGDGTVRIWDPVSGLEMAALTGHGGIVMACAFSADGAWVASASQDKTLKIWDPSRAAKGGLPAAGEALAGPIILCSDGKLATVSYESHAYARIHLIRRWSPDSGDLYGASRIAESRFALISGTKSSTIKGWAFSPDGQRLISWGEDVNSKADLLAYNAASSEKLGKLKGHQKGVEDCVYSPDGRRLVSIDGIDLRIWDTGSLNSVACIPFPRGHLVGYDPGGRRIIAAKYDHSGFEILDGESGATLVKLPGLHPPYAFSPDGALILAQRGYCDRELSLCRSTSGEQLALLNATGCCESCGFSPDGRFAIASAPPDLDLWDVRTGCRVAVLPGRAPFAFSPDGGMIAFAGNGDRLSIWDLELFQPLCGQDTGGFVGSIVWRPDSARILVSGGAGRVLFLRIENVEQKPPIVTGWNLNGSCAYGCSFCRTWSAVRESDVGRSVNCPECGKQLTLNPFTIDADWRPIAAAWGKGR